MVSKYHILVCQCVETSDDKLLVTSPTSNNTATLSVNVNATAIVCTLFHSSVRYCTAVKLFTTIQHHKI